MKILQHIFRFFICAAIGMIAAACLSDDYMFPDQPSVSEDIEYMTMTMQSDKLLPHQVTTRASDPKTEAEKAINHMHVLYFNSVTGKLLTPYVDQKTGKERFFPYVETDLTVIKIDKHAMLEANVQTSTNNDNSLPENLVIYVCVLANMESIIDGVDTEGYPVIGGERVTLNKLEQVLYKHPSASSDGNAILALPKDGMPMVGQKTFTLEENNMSNNLTVELTALMARVDFSIKIDAPIYEENLPKLTMQKWSVHNLPTSVSLSYDPDATTDLSQKGKTSASVVNNQIIYNKNGTVSFSFYMFENLQNAKTPGADYPTYDKAPLQKYKPMLASEDAAYVILDALYTTYDDVAEHSSTYDVKYKLYLGANHTNNFKIRRNYQYKNDITIVGLTNNDYSGIDGNIPETTFDARVNISESNPYYISMLNERTMDAHIGVLPMDIYFFGEAGKQKMKVSVNQPWVGMEKVSSAKMSSGDIENQYQDIVGGNYKAGHGKRRYFTVGLIDELRSAAQTITLDTSRDRIYFYIDENLVLEDREAEITFEYYENDIPVSTEKRVISQTHLLPVNVVHDGKTYRTVYMEAIEEYLDNHDPLDDFNSSTVYDGLPWGFYDATIDNIGEAGDVHSNYVDGIAYTIHVLNNDEYNIRNYTLNSVNENVNAFIYCYNKNKRCLDDGSISQKYAKGSGWLAQKSYYDNTSTQVNNQYELWEENHAKWFLPGISQLEAGLETYFNNYPEFNGNMYWSSAAGKVTETGFLGITSSSASKTHARATNLTADGNHVNSEDKIDRNGNHTTGAGFKLRTDKCRVRAFRWDLNQMASH